MNYHRHGQREIFIVITNSFDLLFQKSQTFYKYTISHIDLKKKNFILIAQKVKISKPSLLILEEFINDN